jgi:hypothetical protein
MIKSRSDFLHKSETYDDLGTGEKKFISLMIGADIHNFVFLANAEHKLKIM